MSLFHFTEKYRVLYNFIINNSSRLALVTVTVHTVRSEYITRVGTPRHRDTVDTVSRLLELSYCSVLY